MARLGNIRLGQFRLGWVGLGWFWVRFSLVWLVKVNMDDFNSIFPIL